MYLVTSNSKFMARRFTGENGTTKWFPTVIGRHETEDAANYQLHLIAQANSPSNPVLPSSADFAVVNDENNEFAETVVYDA